MVTSPDDDPPAGDPYVNEAEPAAGSKRIVWTIITVVAAIAAGVLVFVFWPKSSDDGKPPAGSEESSLETVAEPSNGKSVAIEEYGFAKASSRDAISFGMVVKNQANAGAQGVTARLEPKTAAGDSLTDEPVTVVVNYVMPGKEMAVGATIEGSQLNGELDDVADISVTLDDPEKWWSDDGTLAALARTKVVGEPSLEPRSRGRTYITFVTGGEKSRGGIPYVLVAIFRDNSDNIVGSCFQEWEIVGRTMNAAFNDCYLPENADGDTMRIYGDLVVSELHHIPGSEATEEN